MNFAELPEGAQTILARITRLSESDTALRFVSLLQLLCFTCFTSIPRVQSTWSGPKISGSSQNCPSRKTLMDSATIADGSTPQEVSFVFSMTQSSAILTHSITTHPTRLNMTFANCRWKPCHLSRRAVTVKSTASCSTSPGKPSARLPLDCPT
jgi:hypothetical protein